MAMSAKTSDDSRERRDARSQCWATAVMSDRCIMLMITASHAMRSSEPASQAAGTRMPAPLPHRAVRTDQPRHVVHAHGLAGRHIQRPGAHVLEIADGRLRARAPQALTPLTRTDTPLECQAPSVQRCERRRAAVQGSPSASSQAQHPHAAAQAAGRAPGATPVLWGHLRVGGQREQPVGVPQQQQAGRRERPVRAARLRRSAHSSALSAAAELDSRLPGAKRARGAALSGRQQERARRAQTLQLRGGGRAGRGGPRGAAAARAARRGSG